MPPASACHWRTVKPRTHDKQMLANVCLPTMLPNKSLSCVQKVGQHFMLANNVGRLLAVYELVRSLLANKRQTMRCDWLAVINITVAEWTDASCVDYTNYTSPFHLCIIHDCYQTDFGHLRFRLWAIKQTTAAATSPSAEFAISAILLSNKMLSCVTQMLPNKCWSTIVGQHLLVMCLQL